MKVYKIRHKSTGLFYVNLTASNLSETGILYYEKPDISKCIGLSFQVSFMKHKRFIENDWEIVIYDLVECEGE